MNKNKKPLQERFDNAIRWLKTCTLEDYRAADSRISMLVVELIAEGLIDKMKELRYARLDAELRLKI